METLRLALLLGHLLGFAALVGGLLVQARDPVRRVSATMRAGVVATFVTGLLLVAVLEGGRAGLDHAKIAVKFAIGSVLLVVVVANARRERIPTGLWAALLVLSVVNVAVAVLWSPTHH